MEQSPAGTAAAAAAAAADVRDVILPAVSRRQMPQWLCTLHN